MHIGCKKFACVFCLFLVGFLSFICNPYAAYGDTDGSAAVNVTRENILAIILGGDVTSGSASINVMTNSFNAVFNETGDITATVISTGANGYTLSMDSSTSALTSASSQATIDELAESANGYERASFPANKWGYSLKTGNEYGNYFGMGDGVELQDVSEPTAGTVSTLRLGASIDNTIPDGSYSTAIVFTLTAKVESRLYMQDVAQWQSRLAINESVIATDLRDMKEYWVTRLETDPDIPDGRADCTGEGANRVCTQIWMTQNLDLDLDTETTFTHANTDLGWTDGNTNTVWTPQSATMPYAANVGSENFILSPERSMDLADGGPAYIMDSTYNSLEACVASNVYTEDDCRHYSSGNLYNYYAAAALGATSNNVIIPTSDTDYSIMPNSICPSGWRLPAGLTAADEYSDYDYLFYQNNVTSSHGGASVKLYYIAYGFDHLKTSPLWFNRSGLFQSSDTTWRNIAGFYWTNSVYDYNTAYELVFDSGDITPANAGSSRKSGFSVRCVARPYEPEPLSMQEITAETCPTEPTTVVDSRDGEEYTIQKLADGRCWMLDNLRLDLVNVPLADLKGKTNASDLSLEYLKGDRTDTSVGQYASAAVSDAWATNNEHDSPYIESSKIDTFTTAHDGDYGGRVGVYYNYCAATAGSYCYGGYEEPRVSRDATEDICPSGWRMPVDNWNDMPDSSDEQYWAEYSEIAALYLAYDHDANYAMKYALKLIPSGRIDDASINDNYRIGSIGTFWSSSYANAYYMHAPFYSDSGSVSLMWPDSRGFGIPVRCILK